VTSPLAADDGENKQVSEDRQVSQGLFFASLTTGALGLFVGLILLFGPRGVVLSLGVVAIVLALISYRRAVADSERSGAIGSLLLGIGTAVVGVLVARN
jgi:uncharacterized membrane protein HdeD (DUF308 family)